MMLQAHAFRPTLLFQNQLAYTYRTLPAAIRKIGTLLLAETKPDGSLAASTLNAVSAASALGQPITALVAGDGVQGAAETVSSVQGVSKVLLAQHASLKPQLPEPLAALIQAVHKAHSYTHIVAPGTSWGRNVLPRAAAMLGVQPVADIVKVVDPDTFVRPIYAGNAMATVKYNEPGVRMLTVRVSSFPAAPSSSSSPAKPEPVPADMLPAESSVSKWVASEVTRSARPELGAARVVVCGGRALKSKEQFNALLGPIADALGAAVGASRAAVDAGMAPNDLQVGQTGKVVAPDLYIGIGISGAIQHLAGIKDAKCIVAINNDADAPIFQVRPVGNNMVADYGLVEDLVTALPALAEELKKLKRA